MLTTPHPKPPQEACSRHIKVTFEEEWFLFEYYGIVTLQHIIDASQHLREFERSAQRSIHRLHDYRQLKRLDLNFEKMYSIIAERMPDKSLIYGMKAAFVVSEKWQYGMARMYQQLSEKLGMAVNIFENMEAARIWIRPSRILLKGAKRMNSLF